LKKTGIDLDYVNSSFIVGNENEEMECPCCYNDFSGDLMYSLHCKHFLCKNCWKNYNEIAIKGGSNCLRLKCPSKDCNMVVTEKLLSKTVSNEFFEKYNNYLIKSFIDDDPNIKWCPNPKCEKVMLSNDYSVMNVLCDCGTVFCFQCGEVGHAPLNCNNLTKWELQRKNDSATAHFIVQNTKPCPKCKKSIEKDGGCNYIGCRCGYGFCWICLGPHDHNMSAHVCQKYEDKNLEDERGMLEKYMFYFTRFKTHEQSEELEEKLRKTTELKRSELMDKQIGSYLELDYLISAMEQLFECRKILKWSYPYSYFLNGKKEKSLFDYLQQELETNTEHLSFLLENEATNKQSIVNSSKVAKTRLEHLLDGSKLNVE
jgi:ariadne-1